MSGPTTPAWTPQGGRAVLPPEVVDLHRLVPMMAFVSHPTVILSSVRLWFEEWMSAGGARTAPPTWLPPRIRAAAYRECSLANPRSACAFATFKAPKFESFELTSADAATTLYRRLALSNWCLPQPALWLSYYADALRELHVPTRDEAVGYPHFREQPAGSPFGRTAPLGGEPPLPEIVHEHYRGSGALLAAPLRDPVPVGDVVAS